MKRVLLALIVVVPAWRIDVTSESLVSLRTGAQLEVTIGEGIRRSIPRQCPWSRAGSFPDDGFFGSFPIRPAAA
jgi:hypothetical protein